MLDVSGIDGAGPIWRDLMLAAHRQEPPPFDVPDGIVETTICTPSGLLPTAYCPRTGQERFIAGTQPTEPDDQFRPVTVDLPPGTPAAAATAQREPLQRVYWNLPAEYHEWMVGQGIALLPTDVAGGDAKSGEQRSLNRSFGASDGSVASEAEPLVLSSPVSNTAFQIHPGVPKERQRLKVAGYAADDREWTSLKLIKDGQVLAVGSDVLHVETWWLLEAGEHRFWLEGVASVSGEAEGDHYRSEAALIVVEEFSDRQALTMP